MKNTIYSFTNIPSHYRALLWSKLLNSNNFHFHIFYGTNSSQKIKEIDFNKNEFKDQQHKLHQLDNTWIAGKILIWQTVVIKRCVSDKIDIAIFLGEFQILSTWIAVLICKLRGIKVVFWTHGIYGNESFYKKKIRVYFYKMADTLLLYERRAKNLLMKEGIEKERLKVIFNSLDYDTHKELRESKHVKENFIPTFFKNEHLPYLIFVGRLTRVKKLDLLINAVSVLNETDCKVNLLLVGADSEKEDLKSLVVSRGMQGYVHFYGACYDEAELAKLIYNAILCVSPGNVGLTAIHSLSFGTPVCTHGNFHNQMPEVGAIVEGITGVFFKENNTESLKEVIKEWVNIPKSRETIRKDCYKIIDSFYNPYYQIEIIKNL